MRGKEFKDLIFEYIVIALLTAFAVESFYSGLKDTFGYCPYSVNHCVMIQSWGVGWMILGIICAIISVILVAKVAKIKESS